MSHSTRRGVIAAAGLIATAASTPVLAAPALDLSDPKARLRAFMRLRGSLDEQLVIGCISGRYYGVVEAEVRPLYGVVAATFARYRRLADGRFEGVNFELAYFTDLDSGEVMDRWANPYTGETVDVAHTLAPTSKFVIGEDLALRLTRNVPGLDMRHATRPPLIIGDDLWWTEEVFTQVQIPGRATPLRYSEIVTLQTKVSDLAGGKSARVPCSNAYSSIVNWRPWLKMGDAPGHLMGQGSGVYGAKLADLPAPWLRATQARHPEILKDPAARLETLWQDRT